MLVFSLFFGRLAKLPSDGIPYPLFSYSGLVLWTFFSAALIQASNSLISSSSLITKVYFPRLLIPLGSVVSGLVDLLLASGLLVGLMGYYGIVPPARALLVPLFVLLTFATALGVGLWLSALNVQYRDVRYLVPFLTQFWLFATPIAYPSTLLDEPWRTVYGINPMVGAVEGFRWALVGTDTHPGPMVLVSALVSVLLVVSGAFYFRLRERRFADII
jgi:lipopolysaccharide transport system permease protein